MDIFSEMIKKCIRLFLAYSFFSFAYCYQSVTSHIEPRSRKATKCGKKSEDELELKCVLKNESTRRAQTSHKANGLDLDSGSGSGSLTKFNMDVLVQHTSIIFNEDLLIFPEVRAKLWKNVLSRNVKESFYKFLDVDDCQNFLSSSLNKDTSRVKFSSRSDQ